VRGWEEVKVQGAAKRSGEPGERLELLQSGAELLNPAAASLYLCSHKLALRWACLMQAPEDNAAALQQKAAPVLAN
jgi:hypothetical protein